MTIRLSILLPVYNAEPFLWECLDALLPQCSEGVEVLVLDDCSTDGSWATLQVVAATHAGRVRLLRHSQNQGVSAARNSLLEAATGEYIWFLDADDQLVPTAVATVLAGLAAFSPDWLLFDFQVLRQSQSLKHHLRGEHHRKTFIGPSNTLIHDTATLLEGLFLAGQFHPWSKVSRRALWDEGACGPLRFPVGWLFAEDMATFSRLALRAQTAAYLNVPLVRYRQHAGNVMHSMTLPKIQGLSAALEGFSHDLAATPALQHRLRQTASLAFAISHLSARNYMAAMRFLAAHPELEHAADAARAFARHYRHSSPLTPQELLQAYWRRGWWARYFRARRWVRHVPTLQESIG